MGKEVELFCMLYDTPGALVLTLELIRVTGCKNEPSLRVLMQRLRPKVPGRIVNVRGQGYVYYPASAARGAGVQHTTHRGGLFSADKETPTLEEPAGCPPAGSPFSRG